MWSVIVIFSAAFAIPIKEVVSSPPLSNVNLEEFLEDIRSQKQSEQQLLKTLQSVKSSISDQVENQELADLILQAVADENKRHDRNENRDLAEYILQSVSKNENHKRYRSDRHQRKQKERLSASDADEKSKVYVILKSDDAQSDTNLNDLTSFLTSVLSSFSNNQNQRTKNNGYRSQHNIWRRKSELSKEIYAGNSAEDDYKPKRVRGSDSVGGMRTAIPYVRHRGDIYEKEG